MKFESTQEMFKAFDSNMNACIKTLSKHHDLSPQYVQLYVDHLCDEHRTNSMAHVYLEAELGLYKRTFQYMQRLEHQLQLSVEDKKVCDVGSSGGHSLRVYKELGAKEVIGLEYDKGRVDSCKKYLKYHQVDARIINGSILDNAAINECGNNFDLVTCFDVLEHVPSIKGAIAGFAKLLKINGHVIATHVNRYHPTVMLSEPHYHLPGMTILTQKTARDYFSKVSSGEYQVFDWATQSELEDYFNDVGFLISPESTAKAKQDINMDLNEAVKKLSNAQYPSKRIQRHVKAALRHVKNLQKIVDDPEEFFGTHTFTIYGTLEQKLSLSELDKKCRPRRWWNYFH